jgi:hypothetical protein
LFSDAAHRAHQILDHVGTVKRWRSASMAMRWTTAAMQEAVNGFRRLKAHKQPPALHAALDANQNINSHGVLARQANAA